jgi:hypothetical protein
MMGTSIYLGVYLLLGFYFVELTIRRSITPGVRLHGDSKRMLSDPDAKY